MPANYQLKIFSLLPDQQQASDGMYKLQDIVIGINSNAGLLVMASCHSGSDATAASKSVEILLDDMETNLTTIENKAESNSFVAQCLRESIDNINEFLHFQLARDLLSEQDAFTSLAVFQYFEGHFGYITMAGFSCLLFRQNELTDLPPVIKGSPRFLGETPFFKGQVDSKPVTTGDILVMAKTSDIDAIGLDYLRTTLSRFPDSIDMALRQIKTRAARNGASLEPTVVMIRFDELAVEKRGWLNKLRNR